MTTNISNVPAAGNPDPNGTTTHPLAQTLHDRAGESARETRQAVITLSAASLGFFFIALTSKADPEFSTPQRSWVLVALLSMALGTFGGLWSAWSDARWSYCWAREVEKYAPGEEYWKARKVFWHLHKRYSEHAALAAFVCGVLSAAIYTFLRASST